MVSVPMDTNSASAAGIDSPLGRIGIWEEDGAIVRLLWATEAGEPETPLLREACEQIEAYFDKRLSVFDLPLSPKGTAFEQSIYAAMLAIPLGETRTYGDIAEALGVQAQPVGNACGANPIPVIIPCHRVVGSAGLGGFSGDGGVETKIKLLRHEGAYGLLL